MTKCKTCGQELPVKTCQLQLSEKHFKPCGKPVVFRVTFEIAKHYSTLDYCANCAIWEMRNNRAALKMEKI